MQNRTNAPACPPTAWSCLLAAVLQEKCRGCAGVARTRPHPRTRPSQRPQPCSNACSEQRSKSGRTETFPRECPDIRKARTCLHAHAETHTWCAWCVCVSCFTCVHTWRTHRRLRSLPATAIVTAPQLGCRTQCWQTDVLCTHAACCTRVGTHACVF